MIMKGLYWQLCQEPMEYDPAFNPAGEVNWKYSQPSFPSF
jgi:hypothetical protein